MPIKFPFSRRREVTPETWTKCPDCESQIFVVPRKVMSRVASRVN